MQFIDTSQAVRVVRDVRHAIQYCSCRLGNEARHQINSPIDLSSVAREPGASWLPKRTRDHRGVCVHVFKAQLLTKRLEESR